MTVYVALLRGINVGGKHKVSMPQLRSLAESLGYQDVSTYINSGNLILRSRKQRATLVRELKKGIADEFQLSIDVVVRSADEIIRALKTNPFPEGDPSRVMVAFLSGRPAPGAHDAVAEVATTRERYRFAGEELYLDCADGVADSKLAAQLPKLLGVSATVRNIRTVDKLVELMSGTS